MKTAAEREATKAILAAIALSNGGILTPEDVVKEAERKDSPLHTVFLWDNKKAGHQYRLDQARALIRSVRVEITTETTIVSTVAYVHDPDLPEGEQGYIATASLIGDEERSRTALVAEFSRASAALRRATELAVAFDMQGEVSALADSVQTMRTKVVARTEQRAQ